ncbi:ABC transporter permease [Paenibacillus radicis (ex Xue et al. 2023)]|uniref:ABC transporter permease n=1 Tax=Paenibacillus radicis (ex Xue et al. 2023) TaxID=2972489 RepID=A0ABT1YGU0_9BACL|nr:ABC transporter permease [Paenibacillus radicis (ex Xue et al. 2023)]MCR8632419.1 ABC transporter permease [Paenibacillus radicis (ex Xue et al. 2023)]
MRSLRTLVISMRGLWSYPTRTWLAVLGITISTLLIVFLLSVLYNFKISLVGQVESVGVQQIIAAPGKILNSGKTISQANLSSLLSFASVTSTLTYKDAEDVKEKLPEITGAAPQMETVTTVQGISKTVEAMYTGTTPDYMNMFTLQLEEGRFFTEEETKQEAPVIVLGQTIRQLLFENENSLGEKVKIKGIDFTVIGVLKEKQLIGFNFDERVYTGYPMVSNSANLKNASMIFFTFQSMDSLDTIRDKIGQVMKPNHGGIIDFGLLAADGAIHIINTIADLVTAIAVGITGVSFLVGGIGIMNVMLLTVKERTREIGIRKAVGARWWDILLQFLMEATYISVLGCVLGLAGSYGLLRLLHSFFPVLSTKFPLEMILWCLLFSVVLGILFGISPAIKALRIKPIDALRYE